jgi:REP element-mobilizing transposase RayT
MTAPRHVVPGASYLVTRRCAQRQFLLRPSRLTNETLAYVLALAATRYDVRLHAFCVLSNHYHLIVTDPHARLPAFQQFVDALVARALNASLGRWEAFWAPDTYSAVRLASSADIVDKAAYVLANPVEAGLVAAASAWPGACTRPDQIGDVPEIVTRPNHFFDPNGALPRNVPLELTPPPGFDSPERFRRELEQALHVRQASARKRWHARGGFLGVARVLAQKPTASPRTREPRRELNPRIAARDRWKRAEVLGRLRQFLCAYRQAWTARRRGRDGVVFPHGTYQLRVLHAVPCAGAG